MGSSGAALVPAGGAARDDRVRLGRAGKVPAEGTVTYNGKPLAGGLVQFWPEAGITEATPAVSGLIEDGAFALGVVADDRGVLPGRYKVTVSSFEEVPLKDGETTRRPLIPERYNDAATSGLVVEVGEGGDRELKLELAGAPDRPPALTRASSRLALHRTR